MEFRDDVVAVARKGEAPLNQIAKDFGISEGCLHNWLKKASDIWFSSSSSSSLTPGPGPVFAPP